MLPINLGAFNNKLALRFSGRAQEPSKAPGIADVGDTVEISLKSTSVEKTAPVTGDGLKPVTMEIKLTTTEIGEEGNKARVAMMTVNGKPWRLNPSYSIETQSFENLDYPLPRDSAVAHDILEHILTPWYSPLTDVLGEYLAGGLGRLHQHLYEGDMSWQAALVQGQDKEAYELLKGVLSQLRNCNLGTELVLTFTIPPPDRYFSYPSSVENGAVYSVRRYGEDTYMLRVDDIAKPTGHPYKPITLDECNLTVANDDNAQYLLKQRLAGFETQFELYQHWLIDALAKGTIGSITGEPQSLPELVPQMRPPDGDDYRENLIKMLPEDDQPLIARNFRPAPTLMPAGVDGLNPEIMNDV